MGHHVGGNIMKTRTLRWISFIAIAATAVGCGHNRAYNLPPAQRIMEPGPGVGGPGPGVIAPASAIREVMPAGPMGAAGMPGLPGMAGGPMCGMAPPQVTSIQMLFNRPEGMVVNWDIGGAGYFDSEPLVVPGRYSFPAGAIYRLKVTNIEGREGIELYPTLEIGPVTFRTEAYLAHNSVPVQLTEEDFDQVSAGNFVTKVIYLPDPEFQELALAGVETLVSTRLDPGIDPIVEADRRGSILAIIRMGNKDLEAPDLQGGMGGDVAPVSAYGPAAAGCAPGAAGGVMGPGAVAPYGNVPSHLSGVTVPQWGMPMSGTPIGLPGPPHIPLGAPAGLQSHTIRNHTPMSIPHPDKNFKIHVRQQPGYSYPKPANRMRVVEQNIYPPIRYGQPHHAAHQQLYTPAGGAACVPSGMDMQ